MYAELYGAPYELDKGICVGAAIRTATSGFTKKKLPSASMWMSAPYYHKIQPYISADLLPTFFFLPLRHKKINNERSIYSICGAYAIG